MKRSEILGQVYDAILHRPANTGVQWYLCRVDEKIQCLPMGNMPRPEIIFQILTTTQLGRGFESVVWTRIEAKIYTFLKEKGLCKIP